MSRKFIALITAAALGLAAFAPAPAMARDNDNRDLERAIAAILGVAIVGKIIHDKNKRDDRKDRDRKKRRDVSKPLDRGWEPHVKPRPLPKRVNTRLLPRQCFRTFSTNRGKYRAFGNRCLQNNFRFADRLPHHCKTRIRTNDGPRRVFEARCLRDAGYRLARG